MTILQRFLVLMALMFWQGGFLFYASVVVPIGQKVLASPKDQGFITQQVTDYMNLSGVFALAVLLPELILTPDSSQKRLWIRRLSWLFMAIGLVWLAWWHLRLDALLDLEEKEILNHKAFYPGHRWYLWISTVQWFFGLVYIWTTLSAWRSKDLAGGKQVSE
jgi:hypothetical protein